MDSISQFCPILAPLSGHFTEMLEDKVGIFFEDQEDLLYKLDKIDREEINRNNFEKDGFEQILKRTNLNNTFLNMSNLLDK